MGSSSSSLASGLGHCHDLEEVTVGVFEVESAPAPSGVDLTVRVLIGLTAVGDPLGLHSTEDRVELDLADVEGVVLAASRSGVETRPTPVLRLVGEVERQALVHSQLGEMARLHRQTEDLGEEFGRGDLVLCRNDRVIQSNRHHAPPL
jgi:hypothetical protein